MDDFASGALVAAVLRSLADDGIAVSTPAPGGALAPLPVKRRLRAEVAATHGRLPLLRVGLVLPRLPPDPALSALAAATTAQDRRGALCSHAPVEAARLSRRRMRCSIRPRNT
ncbi:hypothetical protein [Dactylosporangium sp. NPDC000521]|uniref:hypothetical protein n=1 Tax=Dactylosporangium sp. NPDC000521 TaxID=3363975 RepID=UPI0036B511DE